MRVGKSRTSSELTELTKEFEWAKFDFCSRVAEPKSVGDAHDAGQDDKETRTRCTGGEQGFTARKTHCLAEPAEAIDILGFEDRKSSARTSAGVDGILSHV